LWQPFGQLQHFEAADQPGGWLGSIRFYMQYFTVEVIYNIQ
jgi:hypothetical protein